MSNPMRFDHPITLENGLRVRFRLPHAGDRPAVRELFARDGTPVGERQLRRALRFEPRGRRVLCAVAPVGDREHLVGFGAVDPSGDGEAEVVLADERTAPGVGAALAERLTDESGSSRDA